MKRAPHCASFSVSNIVSLGVLAASATLVGCGPAPAEQGADKESQITVAGGSEVVEGDPFLLSTVALTTEKHREKGNSFCSGTLLSPRLVLTAAHCLVDEKNEPLPFDTLVAFGGKVKEAKFVKAERRIPHPDYKPELAVSPFPSGPANDIGLVVLSEPAPEGYLPMEVFEGDYAENQMLTIVGFGVSGNRNRNDTGLMRRVDVKLRGVSEDVRRISTSEWFKGACAGDSGGPVYLKEGDEWRVSGVTSSGMEILGFCMGQNNFTDARLYTDWIREYF